MSSTWAAYFLRTTARLSLRVGVNSPPPRENFFNLGWAAQTTDNQTHGVFYVGGGGEGGDTGTGHPISMSFVWTLSNYIFPNPLTPLAQLDERNPSRGPSADF